MKPLPRIAFLAGLLAACLVSMRGLTRPSMSPPPGPAPGDAGQHAGIPSSGGRGEALVPTLRPARVRTAVVPEAPNSSAGTGLVLQLREEGRPPEAAGPEGVAVLFRAADGSTERAVSDAQGRCRLRLAAPGTLYVRQEGAFPWRSELVAPDPAVERVLPGGARLAGHVTLEGEAAEGFVVRLLCDVSPLLEDAFDEPAVRDFLGVENGRIRLPIACGAGGAFALRRLPEDWSGWLDPAAPWVVPPPAGARGFVGDALRVRAGETDLIVRCQRPVALTGEVVLDPDGAPAAAVGVTAELRYGAEAWSYASASTDAGGAFVLAAPALPTEVRLTVGPGIQATVAATAFSTSRFLGILTLPATASAELLVQGPGGEPVPDAEVVLLGRRTTTDADGRATLGWLPPRAEVDASVVADGFRPASISLLAGTDAPRRVVLEPTNALELVLADPTGFEQGFGVRVDGGILRASPRTNGRWSRSRATPDSVTLWASRGKSLVVEDLPPGVVLPIALLDAYGNVVEELRLSPLGASERRTEVLRVSRSPHAIAGVVLDPDGSPLARAAVTAGEEQLHTDASGRFLFEGFFAERVDLEVAKQGFGTQRYPGLPAGADALELVLERRRPLRVSVRSPSGRLLEHGALAARGPAGTTLATASRRGAGLWTFEGLPRHPLTLVLEVEGRVLEEPVGAQEERLELRVPEWGELVLAPEILASAARETGGAHAPTLVLRDAESGEPVHRYSFARGIPSEPLTVFCGEYDARWSAPPAAGVEPVELHGRLRVLGGERLRLAPAGRSLTVSPD